MGHRQLARVERKDPKLLWEFKSRKTTKKKIKLYFGQEFQKVKKKNPSDGFQYWFVVEFWSPAKLSKGAKNATISLEMVFLNNTVKIKLHFKIMLSVCACVNVPHV